MMSTVVTKKCQWCGYVMKYWKNKLGFYTYWCRVCDGIGRSGNW